MKIIDGTNAILGRLAAYSAKEALKGEEIAIINCRNVIITGGKRSIIEDFEAKRKRVGSTQGGPKISRTSEKIVKTAIRGMLPNYRHGRGRTAFKKIKCYAGIPEELEKVEKIHFENKNSKIKKIKVGDIAKWKRLLIQEKEKEQLQEQ